MWFLCVFRPLSLQSGESGFHFDAMLWLNPRLSFVALDFSGVRPDEQTNKVSSLPFRYKQKWDFPSALSFDRLPYRSCSIDRCLSQKFSLQTNNSLWPRFNVYVGPNVLDVWTNAIIRAQMCIQMFTFGIFIEPHAIDVYQNHNEWHVCYTVYPIPVVSICQRQMFTCIKRNQKLNLTRWINKK